MQPFFLPGVPTAASLAAPCFLGLLEAPRRLLRGRRAAPGRAQGVGRREPRGPLRLGSLGPALARGDKCHPRRRRLPLRALRGRLYWGEGADFRGRAAGLSLGRDVRRPGGGLHAVMAGPENRHRHGLLRLRDSCGCRGDGQGCPGAGGVRVLPRGQFACVGGADARGPDPVARAGP